MASSYQHVPQDPDESYDRPPSDYPDEDSLASDGAATNGFNYRDYRRPADSLKGKLEQKYWKGKQTVIEKFGKSQDEFVVAGDAEMDARLEAFRQIQKTCIDLLKAVEIYQKKIFNLSQEENESGRFLREQGSLDKTKAGQMMISVGKALSYTAQQRLTLRVPLVRLYQEVETFRHRAVGDTWQTVNRMERLRSQYRAALLWMADISKQLDPEEYRKLDKYREVQSEVKVTKKKFDKCKVDVIQKVDLLSASRCNLLSATLVAYQQCLLKFWENTSGSLTKVYEQFRGHPSYQFQMLKHIIPDDSYTRENDVEGGEIKEERITEEARVDEKIEGDASQEEGIEARENGDEDDDDDTLISLDASPAHRGASERNTAPAGTTGDVTGGDADLLGGSPPKIDQHASPRTNLNPSTSAVLQGIDDLLGLAGSPPKDADNMPDFLMDDDVMTGDSQANLHGNITTGQVGETYSGGDLLSGDTQSADDLLFDGPGSQLDLISTTIGDGTSFSETWDKMFGSQSATPAASSSEMTSNDPAEHHTNYLPSDLIDSFENFDPYGGGGNLGGGGGSMPPRYQDLGSGTGGLMDADVPLTPGSGTTSDAGATRGQAGAKEGQAAGKAPSGNLATWLNLFSDLDPLSNPDAIGQTNQENDAKRSC